MYVSNAELWRDFVYNINRNQHFVLLHSSGHSDMWGSQSRATKRIACLVRDVESLRHFGRHWVHISFGLNNPGVGHECAWCCHWMRPLGSEVCHSKCELFIQGEVGGVVRVHERPQTVSQSRDLDLELVE
jgi:hypothetical protein